MLSERLLLIIYKMQKSKNEWNSYQAKYFLSETKLKKPKFKPYVINGLLTKYPNLIKDIQILHDIYLFCSLFLKFSSSSSLQKLPLPLPLPIMAQARFAMKSGFFIETCTGGLCICQCWSSCRSQASYQHKANLLLKL